MAPSMLDVPAMDCLIPILVSVGVFHPLKGTMESKNQVPTSWNTSYTRIAGCFEALALKIERKSKDLRLLSEMQLLPVKACPSLWVM